MNGLGRLIPENFDHVARMPFAVSAAVTQPVEKTLVLPSWHSKHDQGKQGACVGFGTSMMLSILNEGRCRAKGDRTPYIHYNPWWMWNEAKKVDGMVHVDPGDGTTVSAACQILTVEGHVDWVNENDPTSAGPIDPNFGILAVRWARAVDEMRAAIIDNIPMAIGINWYAAFDKPEYIDGEYWIGKTAELGMVRGGHCTAIYGASDQRQAFRMKNSWGTTYPEVWITFSTMDRLLRESGEVSLVTDR